MDSTLSWIPKFFPSINVFLTLSISVLHPYIMQIYSISIFLISTDQPQRVGSSKGIMPTDITAITADESTVYVGTSNGRMVAVPIENLHKTQHANLDVESSGGNGEIEEQSSVVVRGENGKTTGGVAVPGASGGATVLAQETGKTFQKQTAVSLHTQKDSKVRSLIYIPLPVSKLLKPKDTAVLEQTVMYTSLPNLGSMYRLNISQPLHKSLLISVGRGHVKYTSDVECVEESSPLRERNESFQLLVWGHRNTLT